MINIYCDGSSSNDQHGKSHAKWGIECNGRSLTRVGYGTSNQAEYKALILALDYAYQHKNVGPFTIYTDSELIYYQMAGTWKIIDDDLRILYAVASRLRNIISSTPMPDGMTYPSNYVEIKLVGRRYNMRAHILLAPEDNDLLYSGIEDIVERIVDHIDESFNDMDHAYNKADGLPHDLNEWESNSL